MRRSLAAGLAASAGGQMITARAAEGQQSSTSHLAVILSCQAAINAPTGRASTVLSCHPQILIFFRIREKKSLACCSATAPWLSSFPARSRARLCPLLPRGSHSRHHAGQKPARRCSGNEQLQQAPKGRGWDMTAVWEVLPPAVTEGPFPEQSPAAGQGEVTDA